MNEDAITATIKSGYTGDPGHGEGSSTTSSVQVSYVKVGRTFKKRRRIALGAGSPASVLPSYIYPVGAMLSQSLAEYGIRPTTLEVGYSPAPGTNGPAGPRGTLGISDENRAAAIALLDEWLADTSGYDEETWPALKRGIEESRSSIRRRFSE